MIDISVLLASYLYIKKSYNSIKINSDQCIKKITKIY